MSTPPSATSAGLPMTDPPAALPLAVRRELLLARSQALRGRLVQDALALNTPLALVDSLLAGVRWLRQNPEWPLGTLVLLAVLRPRRAARWAARAWWGWRLWQRGRRLLATVTATAVATRRP